jgi:hypothetical protein
MLFWTHLDQLCHEREYRISNDVRIDGKLVEAALD